MKRETPMLQEPETLYKLMALYMLSEVRFALTESQISSFFLEKDYTTYFTLMRILHELADSGLIESRQVGSSTHYNISSDGREALSFFMSDISSDIISDMNSYLTENKFRMRSEASITSDFYEAGSGSYVVRCEVREGTNQVFSMELSVPDKKIAETMSLNWKTKSSEIYSFVMKQLMSSSPSPGAD